MVFSLINTTLLNIFYENLQFLLKKDSQPEALPFSRDALREITEQKREPVLSEILRLSEHFGISVNALLTIRLQPKAEKVPQIKAFFTDVDGVMTDGGMIYTENGDELKKFNTRDGLILKKLVKEGFITGFLSSGTSKRLVNDRAEMFGIDKVYAGTNPKIEVFHEWCSELNIAPAQVAYLGDDLNDLEVINEAGLSATPADGSDQVKSAADIVLSRKGGDACLREFAENYLLSTD